jgi:SAM-dependent methyltransferase
MSRALGAEVAGLDASENFAIVARRRLTGARIEVGEMEALPFSDASFDVVTFINSLQFAGEPVQALAEARRVTRAGGAVLVLVWGRREECELVQITASAVFALLPPSPQSVSPPRAWAEPGVIEGVMHEVGLTPREEGNFPAALVLPDAVTATRAVLAASARAIDHAGIEAVSAAISATLPRVTQPDGRVVWNNRFRWVRATRG